MRIFDATLGGLHHILSICLQVLGDQQGKQFPMDHFVSPHSQWKKALVEGQPPQAADPKHQQSAPKA